MTEKEILQLLNQHEWKDVAWYRRQYEGKADNRSNADLNDEDFLFQFGLIKETPTGRKATIASILLFGQDGYLRGLLPRPVIDCQRYLYHSGAMDGGRWHEGIVCDYNLAQTWTATIEWYYRFAEIPFGVDPKTMQRTDQPVDYVAFREAIVNMLIHQDYSDRTRKPVIQHYSDLTRFWNTGDAFASVSDLLEPGEKKTRNPLIVTAAYACKQLKPVSLSEIKSVLNKSASTCAQVADQLVNQVLFTHTADNSYELSSVTKQRFQVEAQVAMTTIERKILSDLGKSEKSGKQLLELAGYKSRTGNFKRSLEKLLTNELIRMTNPENPKASNQKYVISEHGFRLLKVWEERKSYEESN